MKIYQVKVRGDGEARDAWRNAKIGVEVAKRRRTCRICGRTIKPGEQCVVSDDTHLLTLYNAFWSMKVSAHTECYESLVKRG